jgi:hypothetical protein
MQDLFLILSYEMCLSTAISRHLQLDFKYQPFSICIEFAYCGIWFHVSTIFNLCTLGKICGSASNDPHNHLIVFSAVVIITDCNSQ